MIRKPGCRSGFPHSDRLEKHVRAMYVVATATRTQNANRSLCSVTSPRTLVGLVTLYCMGSMHEHVLSIGNGFDVPYVSALCGQRLAMFTVSKKNFGFLYIFQ